MKCLQELFIIITVGGIASCIGAKVPTILCLSMTGTILVSVLVGIKIRIK